MVVTLPRTVGSQAICLCLQDIGRSDRLLVFPVGLSYEAGGGEGRELVVVSGTNLVEDVGEKQVVGQAGVRMSSGL